MPEDIIDHNATGIVSKLVVLFNNSKIDYNASVDEKKNSFSRKKTCKSRRIKIGDTLRYIKNLYASKSALEAVGDSYGDKVLRYLADNCIFAKSGFHAANQCICFYTVSVHNQTDIVERKNGLWSYYLRALMIHSQRHQPKMITIVIWLYAWKAIGYRDNVFGLNRNGWHPVQAFCGTSLPYNTQLKDLHTWGWPTFFSLI